MQLLINNWLLEELSILRIDNKKCVSFEEFKIQLYREKFFILAIVLKGITVKADQIEKNRQGCVKDERKDQKTETHGPEGSCSFVKDPRDRIRNRSLL